MPTAREVKIAQKILREARSAVAIEISPSGEVGGGDRLLKIQNVNENVGLRPALALTAAIIRKAREFKAS